jgi:hypothetical protein
MKRIVFVSIFCFITFALLAQSNKEPVYISNLFVGPYICEFAANGTENKEMKDFIPYIFDGKLYFFCRATPAKSGNLRPGFEFYLANDVKSIKGKYQGNKTDYISSEMNFIPIAGYAEKGKITVTQVFLDEQSLEQWSKTIKYISE